METLQIRILGDFSLQIGENIISDNDNRTKKGWLLLAYLLYNRGQLISQRDLIRLLWSDSLSSSNPENALRITLHRLRAQLNQLWPTAGHDLILYKSNGYSWNTEIPIFLDSDHFEQLCRSQSKSNEERLQACLEALQLYNGDFLEKQSSESWVIPISTHFHNLFLTVSMEAVSLLSAENRHQEAIAICKKAISAEPYHEPLHQTLMLELAALGDSSGAHAVYEDLRKKLFDDFGIQPSEQTRAVFRSVAHTVSNQVLPVNVIMENLREPEISTGALQCDYDYFKILCFAESRSMERSLKPAHIALLSVSDGPNGPLTKRTMSRIMDQLGEQIRLNLRRRDTFCRCSTSQYIFLLPEANYENSHMVCRRILGAFHRKHPSVTAKINYVVQPLTMDISVP